MIHTQKSEKLTKYQLHCGYIQKDEFKDMPYNQPTELSLYEQHGAYFVNNYDYEQHIHVYPRQGFSTLTEARKEYARQKSILKKD